MSDDQLLLIDGVNPNGRLEDDFYATPPWMVGALMRRIVWFRFFRLLEPCAGNGAIVRALPPQFEHVITNDIVQRDPLIPDYILDAKRRESWDAFRRPGEIDVTLTNPPFVDTFEIAQLALEYSRFAVVLLQRCTWIEPTEARDEWLAAHPPHAQIVMPRWNFRSVDGKGGNDSAPPSWFIWNRMKEAPLCSPGLHIVTRRERDELLREAA